MQQIKLTDITLIKPYEKNAKKHPVKQVKQVANSIKSFGFNQPIVVDKNNIVIVGHGRLEAAKLLELTEVPVITLDLTEEQAKAYRIADNKLNESEWDMQYVIDELSQLKVLDFDISLTGFSDSDLQKLKDETEIDLSNNIAEKFEIAVECANEQNQEEIYQSLINQGLTCRLLTL